LHSNEPEGFGAVGVKPSFFGKLKVKHIWN